MAASQTYGSTSLIAKNTKPVSGFTFKGDAFKQTSGWVFQMRLSWSVMQKSCHFDQPLKQSLSDVLARQQKPNAPFIPGTLTAIVLGEGYLCPVREKLWAERLLVLRDAQTEQLASHLANGIKGSSFVQIICDPSWDVPVVGQPAPLWAEEDRLLAHLMHNTQVFRQIAERDYWPLRRFASEMLARQLDWADVASLIEAWTPFVDGWERGLVATSELEKLPALAEKATKAPPRSWHSFATRLKDETAPCVEAFDF